MESDSIMSFVTLQLQSLIFKKFCVKFKFHKVELIFICFDFEGVRSRARARITKNYSARSNPFIFNKFFYRQKYFELYRRKVKENDLTIFV